MSIIIGTVEVTGSHGCSQARCNSCGVWVAWSPVALWVSKALAGRHCCKS